MKFLKNPLILAIIYLFFSFAILFFFFIANYQLIRIKQKEVLLLELQITENQIISNFEEIKATLLTVESHLQISVNDNELLLYLQQIDQNSESMASIYFGKPDKTMINSSGFVPGPGFDLTTRVWYQMALASDSIVFTPAFINATESRVIVTAAKAIYNNDVLIGVLAIDIDIRTITGFVSEKQIGENGFAFLIDSNGSILAHPRLEANDISLTSISEYDPNMMNVNESNLILNYKIGGIVGVLAYDFIDDFDYVVGVFLPRTEFSSSLMILSIIFGSLVIILFLLAGILIYIYDKKISKPLNNLIEDIDSINLLNSSSYRLPEPDKDDYLNIRTAFNKIIDKTNLYLNERKVVEHQLLIENQRVRLLMESAVDIIFEIDMNQRYVSVFGRGVELFGLPTEEYIGKTILELFGTDYEVRKNAYDNALKGKASIFDWTYVYKGQKYYFETAISPIFDETMKIIGAVGISRDITEPMRKQKEIEYISIHDFLTGLYNRRYFVEVFAKKDDVINYPLGIMMIDLNGLKILNDAYGHVVGDRALVKVGEVLTSLANESDVVCRIGGDEFAIIFTHCSLNDLDQLKDLIQQRLGEILIENIPLSVAIGYEIKTDNSMNLEDLIKNAENHMYRNKVTEGRSVRNSAIKAILKTLTDKFEEEKTHSTRVSDLCKRMGEVLNLKTDDLKELEIAGLFHDIGKISIPDEILHKPSRLTKAEFDVIKTHTENGYHILRAADEYSNLAEYALSHHEHWNGLGYPRGLSGTDIPLFSRIICIVDAYEAMTSNRVYRKKMEDQEAVNEIIKYSGSQFDPDLARIFIEKVLGYPFVIS